MTNIAKSDKRILENEIMGIAEQIGQAYQKHREWELTLKACPKCQFEAVENDKCGHCGFNL